MHIKTVDTDKFSMDYCRFGSGKKTMVIIPGLSVQSVMPAADAIEAVYRKFEDDYTVYVFDRRREVPDPYSVKDMARDTVSAIKALGLKDIYLCGASQGGMMAQVIAIENPELVKKLAIASSSAHVKDEQYKVLKNWRDLAEAGDREGLYLAFGKEIYPPEVFEQYKSALIAAAATVTDEELRRFVILAEGIKGFDITGELDRIQCPVLAVGDADDKVLDSDATMEIAEKLDEKSGFMLFMYNGFGHAAYDTAPGFTDRLFRFFED